MTARSGNAGPTLAFLAALWIGSLAPLELVEPRYYLPFYAALHRTHVATTYFL